MSTQAKGYVVRWLDFSDDLLTSMDAVERRDTLPEIMAVYNDLGCMSQALFSVSDDGTETPLPTYEEALAALAEVRHEAQKVLATKGPARGMRVALLSFRAAPWARSTRC